MSPTEPTPSIPDPAASDAREPFRHKWWGWGAEGARFDIENRPRLWPWILSLDDQSDEIPARLPEPDRASIRLRSPRDTDAFRTALADVLPEDRLTGDEDERLRHAFGRSFRDLVRLRTGDVPHPPDLVAFPESTEEVEALVAAAVAHDVVLIPFGGGTNIVGCVEPDAEVRPVVTVDMTRMNRLVELDERSGLAVLETGMFGPQVEAALRARGFTLGHHPDSFVYSTLGGWIATRSAGTQSNEYGKIEDMVVGLDVVTPTGRLRVKPLPAASNGPDLKRLLTGSEGTMGIITRATMRVHPIPEVEDYRLILFPSFRDGVQALHGCVREGVMPSLARLSDERETEFIAHSRPVATGLERWLQKPVKAWLGLRGYDRPALMILGIEGPRRRAEHLRHSVLRILREHGGLDLGRKGGEAWKESRYDVPYLRDYLLDYGFIGDSFESATSWGRLEELHARVVPAVEAACQEVTGRPAYVGAHVSHLYETGACLYLTVGAHSGRGYEHLEAEYDAIKAAATRIFVEEGAALSHHHAVGYEHGPWLGAELSEPGVRLVDAAVSSLDPGGHLAPWNLGPTARQGRSGSP